MKSPVTNFVDYSGRLDDVFVEMATVVDELARVKCRGARKIYKAGRKMSTISDMIQAESKHHNSLRGFWQHAHSVSGISKVDSMAGLSYIFNHDFYNKEDKIKKDYPGSEPRKHGTWINLEKVEEFSGSLPHLYPKECDSGLIKTFDENDEVKSTAEKIDATNEVLRKALGSCLTRRPSLDMKSEAFPISQETLKRFRWLSITEEESKPLISEPENSNYGWIVSPKEYAAYDKDKPVENEDGDGKMKMKIESMIENLFKWEPDPKKIRKSSKLQGTTETNTFYEFSLNKPRSELGFERAVEAIEDPNVFIPLSRSLTQTQ